MAQREYPQGVANLAFKGGPSVIFRLDPNTVDWKFQIDTSVTDTLGGRVVQVLGATLSDIVIAGSFGQVANIQSKQMAEAFLTQMSVMADWQSRDSRTPGVRMQAPAVFSYPPKGWMFEVYIKDLSDPDGGGVTHKVGKSSYNYRLTLAYVSDISGTSKVLGSSNGFLDVKKDAAIQSYVDRIADGIGWHASEYNGHLLSTQLGVSFENFAASHGRG